MDLPKRKALRLKDHDHSQTGGYFITFCTEDRAPLLGNVVVGGGVLDAPQVELISTIKRLTSRAWGTPLWQRG